MDLDSIIARVDGLTDEQRVTLRTLLLVREDGMADHFRLAAQQFGMFPFIVAEVIASAGLGTPHTEQERLLIRNNFIEGMNELRRQQEGG